MRKISEESSVKARVFALLAALLVGGCAEREAIVITHNQITEKPLARESVYYTEVKTSSGSTLGTIYHVNAGGEVTALASEVDKAFWKAVVLQLTGSLGNIAAAAVHGVSFPAAKTAISAVATGGSSTNTNTNTNNACTGNNSC